METIDVAGAPSVTSQTKCTMLMAGPLRLRASLHVAPPKKCDIPDQMYLWSIPCRKIKMSSENKDSRTKE
jgi:hypothetical protein